MASPRLQCTAILLLALFGARAQDAPKAACELPQDEEVSLMQVNLKVKMEPQAEGTPEKSEGNTLGVFEELAANVEEGGACEVAGRWNDAQGPAVSFKATMSEVALTMEGLPSFAMYYDNSGAKPKLEKVQVGETTAPAEEFDSSATMQHGVQALLDSSLAAGRGKLLSSKLGQHGLDGGKAPCAFRLHMLLATMAKVHQKQELNKATEAATASETAALQSNATATLQPWNSYYGASTDQQCPHYRAAGWQCRFEPSYWWGSNGPWIQPPDTRLTTNINWAGNINCQSTDASTDASRKCGGLCGALCDCWESLCGSQYGCGYNPWCCAHDWACNDRFSVGCIDAAIANYYCQDPGLASLGLPR